MKARPARRRWSPVAALVARRGFRAAGRNFRKGDPFPWRSLGLSEHMAAKLFAVRFIDAPAARRSVGVPASLAPQSQPPLEPEPAAIIVEPDPLPIQAAGPAAAAELDLGLTRAPDAPAATFGSRQGKAFRRTR